LNASSSWIEPPPQRHGPGCFVKGCLILVIFFILLGLAFIAGYYYAERHESLAIHHESLPISHATLDEEQAVRERWDAFEKAARAHEVARIELTTDDLNALIASDSKLRGNAYVTINGDSARVQVSMPLAKGRWFSNRYVNAQCSVQSGPNQKPEDIRITNIVLNGKPVSEEVLSWRYGALPSFRSYMADWISRSNLKTFEITDGKVILETNVTTSGGEDPFTSVTLSPTPSPTPTP